MTPEKALTIEDAYELATKRFMSTGIPQEVSTVFVEREVGDTLVGVPVVDHYVITAKPEGRDK